MTWTVTDHGVKVTTTFSTPVGSLSMTGLSIPAGHAVAVFVQYTDVQTDAISVTDSASQTYTLPANVNLVDSGTGQGLVALYNASLGSSITSVTASFGMNVIQALGVMEFVNSVAGTPTLDGNIGHDTNPSSSTPNSGAGNSTNGDLVLTGAISAGPSTLGPTSLAITGVTSPTISTNADSTAGQAQGWGVTTTTGNVTSTWTVTSVSNEVVLELIFAPPAAGGGLSLMGQACLRDRLRDFIDFGRRKWRDWPSGILIPDPAVT